MRSNFQRFIKPAIQEFAEHRISCNCILKTILFPALPTYFIVAVWCTAALVLINYSESAAAGDINYIQGSGFGSTPSVEFAYNDCIWPVLSPIASNNGVITLLSNVGWSAKARVSMISLSAAPLFLPWILPEVAVFKAKQGLSNSIGWQGFPTGDDLRSIWASFIGMPPVPGCTSLALAVGLLLAGVGLARIFKRSSPPSAHVIILLMTSAVLPPFLLFATCFPPLSLTIFSGRHLVPSIFASLVLVSLGLWECSRMLAKPALTFVVGALCLCALQWSATARILYGSVREPYSEISTILRTKGPTEPPVYTTWPYGIGATVKFLSGCKSGATTASEVGITEAACGLVSSGCFERRTGFAKCPSDCHSFA